MCGGLQGGGGGSEVGGGVPSRTGPSAQNGIAAGYQLGVYQCCRRLFRGLRDEGAGCPTRGWSSKRQREGGAARSRVGVLLGPKSLRVRAGRP